MVNKWEIYYCCLDPVVGSEQMGMRPVLVISTDAVNHNLPVSTVLPFSSVKPDDKIYPTEILMDMSVTDLPKLSVAMVQQIRTVSHNRLIRHVGMITDAKARKAVLDACRSYLDL